MALLPDVAARHGIDNSGAVRDAIFSVTQTCGSPTKTFATSRSKDATDL
jgi:hypothetical protein